MVVWEKRVEKEGGKKGGGRWTIESGGRKDEARDRRRRMEGKEGDDEEG